MFITFHYNLFRHSIKKHLVETRFVSTRESLRFDPLQQTCDHSQNKICKEWWAIIYVGGRCMLPQCSQMWQVFIIQILHEILIAIFGWILIFLKSEDL